MSKRFELGFEDYKRIARQVVIIYSPVILMFMSQIESWNFDYKIIYALLLSTTFDVARRYLTDYSKK